MSDVITKNGRGFMINIKALEEIKADLSNLPQKQRTFLTTNEAIAFLLPSIISAREKNYTNSEIQDYFAKSGWDFTQCSSHHFWNTFHSMAQGNRRKKHIEDHADSNVAEVSSEFITNIVNDVKEAETDEQVSEIYESLKKSLPTVNKTHSSAHFDIPPDTEDL